MKSKKETNKTKGTKKSTATNVLFTSAIVVLLIAIASLVITIKTYYETVAQYVEQGYKSAEVVAQLLPNQLLPGIFESIAIYAGIAFLLFGMGTINHKLSQHLEYLPGESAKEFVGIDDSVAPISDAPKETSNTNLPSSGESEN